MACMAWGDLQAGVFLRSNESDRPIKIQTFPSFLAFDFRFKVTILSLSRDECSENPTIEPQTNKTPNATLAVSSSSPTKTEYAAQQQIDNPIARHFKMLLANFITKAIIMPPAV